MNSGRSGAAVAPLARPLGGAYNPRLKTGQVPLFISNVAVISQRIEAGALRPLGVTTAGGGTRRVPGVGGFAQQGFAAFEAPTWWAFSDAPGRPSRCCRR